jgi:serine/threonine protein kinase
MIIKPNDLGMRFLGNYELGEYIDKGGNGAVYKVTRNHDGSIFALKCLLKSRTHEWDEKRKVRFRNEIKTLNDLSLLGNPYVMPIIDNNTSDEGLHWYMMPLGKTISEVLLNEKIDFYSKLQYFIDIAKGIKSIHELGYCHRDIKPDNILIVEDKIKLSDFGLVWHPSFEPRTHNDEKVGPTETIAPEMRENIPELKHSSKADIYSFVKTIWMLILGRKRAFVDQYSYETKDYLNCSMEIFRYDGIRTFSRLNDLIMRGTEYLPVNRPSIDEVIKELESFAMDNKLSDKDISYINHIEVIRQNLYMIESDIETIINSSKIKDFLNGIFKSSVYLLENERLDGSFDTKFEVKRIQVTEIESVFIFESTTSKRYLLVVNMLEIDKQKNKISICTKDIKTENLPINSIYEYLDYYSVDLMDRLIGNFEEQNEKSIIEVMSKAERFILSVAN